MDIIASKLQQRRLNLWRALKNQAPESLVLAILENYIGLRESAKASHTRNWKSQLKIDVKKVWKENMEAWLKEAATKLE